MKNKRDKIKFLINCLYDYLNKKSKVKYNKKSNVYNVMLYNPNGQITFVDLKISDEKVYIYDNLEDDWREVNTPSELFVILTNKI